MFNIGIFKKKCSYCAQKLSDSFHEEDGKKFCCPNCAKAYKEQVKKLENKYSKKSCCH